MRNNRISKVAVAGIAASMAFATAAPALACQTSGDTGTSTTGQTASLAQQQAWLDAYLVRGQQRLAALAAKVASDPELTSAQRSAWASWIAAEQAKLTGLKSAVDAATTTSALDQLVRTALHDWWAGFGSWRRERPVAHRRSLQHPSAIKQPEASTVVLRSRHPSGQSMAGRHRSDQVAVRWQQREYWARHGFGDRTGRHDSGRDWGSHRR